MQPSRSLLSLLSVLLLLVVVGATATWRILAEPAEGGEAAADSLPSTEGVEVESAALFATAQAVEGVEVVRDTLWVQVEAAGTAEAYRRTTVATRREGVIEAVLVREDDAVEAGELLVQLDTLDAAMEMSAAQAALRQAENEFEIGMLAGGDIEDPAIREERERNLRIEAGLVEAETRLRRAELEMAFTRVTAPFAGRVADLEAVEGAFLGSGAEVLTLVQLDPIRVQAEVLESDLPLVSAGRRAEVRFSAIPETGFDATVESVNPVVDPDTRSGRVTLVLPNPDARIKPGMYATVRLDAESYPDRVLVPLEAVVERGTPRREVVFMLQPGDEEGQGRSEWRYVTTGQRNGALVEIVPDPETSILEPGEVVLIDGHHYLAHDVPVRLVEDVQAAGGRPGG